MQDRSADYAALAAHLNPDDPGDGAELGGADRREILRVREQHRPFVADPVVEPDSAFGGLGFEIGRGRIDLKGHFVSPGKWKIPC